jgi:hypothetical protein
VECLVPIVLSVGAVSAFINSLINSSSSNSFFTFSDYKGSLDTAPLENYAVFGASEAPLDLVSSLSTGYLGFLTINAVLF